MKRILFFMSLLLGLVVSSMTLVSCGDDEPEPNKQEQRDDGSSEVEPTDKTPNGVVAVDLGLSSGTLWANRNIGALSNEAYGDYFAWGETEGYNSGKTCFYWDTYKWCNGSNSTMTKYCHDSSYGYSGFTDNKSILDPEDDAAYVNWGSKWRMPTDAQLNELKENCTWVWKTVNDIKGYKVIGPNGNSIFLPTAGYRDDKLRNAASEGDYWSHHRYYDMDKAYYLSFDSYSVGMGSYEGLGRRVNKYYRCYGLSIRPVRATE